MAYVRLSNMISQNDTGSVPDLARELSNRPTVLLASAEFLASTEVPLRHLLSAHSIVC